MPPQLDTTLGCDCLKGAAPLEAITSRVARIPECSVSDVDVLFRHLFRQKREATVTAVGHARSGRALQLATRWVTNLFLLACALLLMFMNWLHLTLHGGLL